MGKPKSEARARKIMLPELGHPGPRQPARSQPSRHGASEGPGSQSSPSFPQAPNPGERVPGLGSAKPIACDATAGSDLMGEARVALEADSVFQPPAGEHSWRRPGP